MRPDLSVVVPVYNEAESLPTLADEVRQALDGSGLTFEVWLVDDGSDDGSWPVIERIHGQDGRFAGVQFRRNYGKSAALAAGFGRAGGRYVATLDADLQDDPAELFRVPDHERQPVPVGASSPVVVTNGDAEAPAPGEPVMN